MSPQNEYTEAATPYERLFAALVTDETVLATLQNALADTPRPSLKQLRLSAHHLVAVCDRYRDAVVEFLREVQPDSELIYTLRELDEAGLVRAMPGVIAGLFIELSRAGELVKLSALTPADFPAACAEATQRRIQLETFKRCHASV